MGGGTPPSIRFLSITITDPWSHFLFNSMEEPIISRLAKKFPFIYGR
jgi:hypothetical protein